ncbi:hypothetical protein NDU88_004554 [Pleurodeles waltl]|uniref:Uncharacterized protein n=1 Tax=Pleurodeles waltl TaxID=8319 RepID=A0AAV7WVU7_PLEWA|nr:hypothetical protein NDU88_004554 [Pleurodeles waltl]
MIRYLDQWSYVECQAVDRYNQLSWAQRRRVLALVSTSCTDHADTAFQEVKLDREVGYSGLRLDTRHKTVDLDC